MCASTAQTRSPEWVNQRNDSGTFFEPVRNPSPKTLSREQIATFNQLGFIEPLTLFDEQEAVLARQKFDETFRAFYKKGADSYGINGYQASCQEIWDIATNPRLLDHIEDLIGPNIVCWGTHYFCKLAGDDREVPFHQDATYWPFHPFRAVTVWLAVDDVTSEAGPMCFLPGSHLEGKRTWRRRTDNVVLGLEVLDPRSQKDPFPLLLKAGQFSLHTDLLVHGSGPNRSVNRRCGLTLRYVPTHVWLQDESARGWVNNAIICRGTDPTGRWPNNPRPAGNVITQSGS